MALNGETLFVEDMRQAKPDSPRISHLSWGRIEVEGHLPFGDAKIFPGGAREWDWRETGTRHVPGIQPADVQELIEHGARTVVLSKGAWERLQVCPETQMSCPGTASKSKSCRPRLLWSALTSSVKTSRSAVYSILHAEQPQAGVLGGQCERLTLIKRREVRFWHKADMHNLQRDHGLA